MIREAKLLGRNILPPVMAVKRIYTSTRMMSMACFFSRETGSAFRMLDSFTTGFSIFAILLPYRFCRLDSTSKTTAPSSTRPLTTFCRLESMPTMFMPWLMTPISTAPMIMPDTLPTPP